MITLTVNPDAQHAAFNPVLWEVTSDRSGNTAFVGKTPADNGGFCQFTLGTSHGIQTDDVLTLSLFSVLPADDYYVTATTATTITISLAWDASYAGDSGTLTKNNQNLNIKITLQNPVDTVATKYVKEFDSKFSFDISEILQGLVSYDKCTEPASASIQSPSNPDSVVRYRMGLSEHWIDKYGNQYDDSAGNLDIQNIPAGSANNILAYSMALNGSQEFTDYEIATSKDKQFLTKRKEHELRPGEAIEFHAIVDESAITTISYMRKDYVSGVATEVTGTITVNYARVIVDIPYSALTAGTEYFELYMIDDVVAKNRISEIITVTIKNNCLRGARVTWKNRLGGIDSYTFNDHSRQDNFTPETFESENTVNTANTKNKNYIELNGRSMNKDEADWIKELMASRFVWVDFKDGEGEHNAVPEKLKFTWDTRGTVVPKFKLRLDNEINS